MFENSKNKFKDSKFTEIEKIVVKFLNVNKIRSKVCNIFENSVI